MKKPISFYLSTSIIDRLRKKAKSDSRSVSQTLDLLLQQSLQGTPNADS